MRPALLVLALTLAACSAGTQRTVQSLSASGAYIEAVEAALRAQAAGEDVDELLALSAAEAYRVELDRAREAEADDDLAEALAVYDRMIALSDRVVQAGGPALPEGIVKERTDVARATATLYAARGSVAFEAGRFDEALGQWRLAEGTHPSATDAETRIPRALNRLGDQAREERRYREAIALYDEAVELGGGEAPRVWAAAIHAALGRHALENGACRKAVEELTAASALPYDVKLARDLDAARACATAEIVVHPFEDLVDGGLDDDNLGVLLVDQLHHHLRTQGSRYVVLLDPASKAARTDEHGPGYRFDVRGHLTRVEVESGESDAVPRSVGGTLKVPCETGGEARCEESLTVAYTLSTERLEVDIAGAIKVVDRDSGEQVTTRPLDIRVTKERHTAADPKVTDARGFVVKAPVGLEATERQVGVASEAADHFAPSPPLPETDRVVDEAVVRLAATAAEAVLAAVDTEDPLADPDRLRLVTPVTSAAEIRFGDALIEEEAPPEPEPVADDEGGTPVDPEVPAEADGDDG